MTTSNAIHTLARAVIIDNGHLLVCKTLDLPINFYFLPGGHIEHGESAHAALVRELMEEAGAPCAIKRFLGCLEYSFEPDHNSICHNHEYNLIFEVSSDVLSLSRPIPDLEKHIELTWIPLNQLEKIDFRPEPLKKLIPQWLNEKNKIFASEMVNLKNPNTEIKIRPFEKSDIPTIVAAFDVHHWPKPQSTFDTYLKEQQLGERVVWIAYVKDQFAGYVTLKWTSPYAPFTENKIPEIMDMNVLPPFRNQGIASQLLDKAESTARTKSTHIGIGVGLYKDYGSAQKLYVKRGYIPDGHGVTYLYQPVAPGNSVPLDDDLVLWFMKKL